MNLVKTIILSTISRIIRYFAGPCILKHVVSSAECTFSHNTRFLVSSLDNKLEILLSNIFEFYNFYCIFLIVLVLLLIKIVWHKLLNDDTYLRSKRPDKKFSSMFFIFKFDEWIAIYNWFLVSIYIKNGFNNLVDVLSHVFQFLNIYYIYNYLIHLYINV